MIFKTRRKSSFSPRASRSISLKVVIVVLVLVLVVVVFSKLSCIYSYRWRIWYSISLNFKVAFLVLKRSLSERFRMLSILLGLVRTSACQFCLEPLALSIYLSENWILVKYVPSSRLCEFLIYW